MGLTFKQVVMMMMMMLLLQAGLRSHGCLDDEMHALLQLKSFFNNSKKLSEWVSDSNCCNWARISCNHTIGRVRMLNLGYVRDNTIAEDWYLNASLFLPFKYLESLDLSGNNIVSCLEDHGFDKLSGLSILLHLQLSDNKFNNSVLSSLNSLPHMERLYLDSNKLQGRINVQGLSSLNLLQLANVTQSGLQIVGASPSLQALNLQNNIFRGPIFGEYSGNLTNVEYSNMFGSLLDELAVKSLRYLPSLKQLALSYLNDSLVGFIHWKNLEALELWDSTIMYGSSLERIANSNTLERLGVENSVLGGDFFSTAGLCNLSRLTFIYLDNIELKTLPKCLANMTYLQSLYLGSQHLRIPASLSPLMNNSNLINLVLDAGEIYEDKQQVQSLIPRFQLNQFKLAGHGSLSSFPKFLYHQYNLSDLLVENVQIGDEFPYWLLSNNSNLQELVLRNLSLRGSFQLPMQPLNYLYTLDISNNHLHGYISSEFSSYFRSLMYLNMSFNYFTGSILPSLCNLSSLQTLELSYNEFSEQIPSHFPSLMMSEAYLNNNKFQGFSKDPFLNSSHLVILDLSYNSLTGDIPASVSRFSVISFLILHHNRLVGRIPIELCKLDQLSFIDLSYNNLLGHIPSCLKLTLITNKEYRVPVPGKSLASVHDLTIRTNGISQAYSRKIFNLFCGMDLSYNNLSGEIPLEMGNLSCVHSLNFSHNNLIGSIPSTLSKLRQIMSLDLSHNKLQGNIPSELTQLTSLSSFSVAYNNLSGKTPGITGQFVTFKADSYEGNPFLCGFPLEKNCTSKVLPPSSENSLRDDSGFMDMIAFYASLGASYWVVLLGMLAVLCINPNWRRVWLYFIETVINNVYYFLVDKLLFPFGLKVYQPLV